MEAVIERMPSEKKTDVLKEIGALGERMQLSFQALRIKAALQKDAGKRTEADIEAVINLIKDVDFFRTKKMLSYGELRDLAQSLTFEQAPAGTDLILCGEKVTNKDKFYVILQGTVSVLIRNEVVDQWEWAMSVFNALKDWKEKEFDKKVAKAMRTHYERFKRDTEAQIDKTIQRQETLAAAEAEGKPAGPGRASQRRSTVVAPALSDRSRRPSLLVGSPKEARNPRKKESQQFRKNLLEPSRGMDRGGYANDQESLPETRVLHRLSQLLNPAQPGRESEDTRAHGHERRSSLSLCEGRVYEMQNWKSRQLKQANERYRFDCEKYIELTPRERQNLSQLKRFSRFKWFLEANRLKRGEIFGEAAFEADDVDKMRRNATVRTRTQCDLAVLSRRDYIRVLRKLESKVTNNRSGFLLNIPYLSHLAYGQIKKLSNVCTNQYFQRQEYVHHQGQEPKTVRIVVDGDFEIIRMRKNQNKLIDPTKSDKIAAARYLSKENALTFLGPRLDRNKQASHANEKVEYGGGHSSLNKNNTLRQGRQN